MTSPLHWNDPTTTWKLASYEPPVERREAPTERRDDARRAAIGDRRRGPRRTLTSARRL